MSKKIFFLIIGFLAVMAPCQAKGFFKSTKNFFVKAISAPVKMVGGLFHKKKNDVPQSSVHQERGESFKELVKKRNDLLWANQKTLLEDLLNNKSTKTTRGEMFICEIEHEEKILGILEKEISLLCYEVANDSTCDKKFSNDVQSELVQTILLKERMHKLLQVIKTK